MGCSVTVTCEADCYIDEFETEDLVAELKRRKHKFETKDEREGLIEVSRRDLGQRLR